MKRILSAAVVLAAACAQESAEDVTPAANESASENTAEDVDETLRLYAFDCGRIDMLDLSLFSQGDEYDGRENAAAVMCYLIRHPKGDLVWDAGLPDAISAEPEGVTTAQFHLEVPVTMQSQLELVGVPPADVEYFSTSHSHFDHVGNAGLFAGSTFIVDKDERAFMFRDEARADAQSFPLVAPLETAETLEFDGDYDVFGDGSVKIIATPGHTPGHTSLLLNLANEGPVLLSGDLYHLHEAREKRTVPDFNTDAEQTLQSMDRFEALAAETGARVIIQHSLEDMAELPKPPAYLD